MKDKIISFVIWLVVWWALIYWYMYFIEGDEVNNSAMNNRGGIDSSNMDEQQLERMAERIGISKEELKKKLDAWENIRDLMPQGWGSRWWNRWDVTWEGRSGSWSEENK